MVVRPSTRNSMGERMGGLDEWNGRLDNNQVHRDMATVKNALAGSLE